MKKTAKRIGFFIGVIFLALLVFGVWQRELVAYGWLQLKGQLHVINEAKPISELQKDPSFPDSLKKKLEIIRAARAFGREYIGMKNSDNYTKIYDQKGKDILWNVSASEPYELKAYEWKFPVAGAFSYKGFFDLEKAKKERDKIKSQGFDTNIRSVSAWSTLGWFEDVLLSKNLERSHGDLAELILHELTHATIYVKDSVDFNENLANFIGKEGAKKFLIAQYGKGSDYHSSYIKELADLDKYRNFMLQASKSLDSLYQKLEEQNEKVKENQKQQHLQLIKNSIDTVSFSNPLWKQNFKKRHLNNTNFMSVRRYNAHQDTLQHIYQNQFDSNLKAFLAYFEEKYPSL